MSKKIAISLIIVFFAAVLIAVAGMSTSFNEYEKGGAKEIFEHALQTWNAQRGNEYVCSKGHKHSNYLTHGQYQEGERVECAEFEDMFGIGYLTTLDLISSYINIYKVKLPEAEKEYISLNGSYDKFGTPTLKPLLKKMRWESTHTSMILPSSSAFDLNKNKDFLEQIDFNILSGNQSKALELLKDIPFDYIRDGFRMRILEQLSTQKNYDEAFRFIETMETVAYQVRALCLLARRYDAEQGKINENQRQIMERMVWQAETRTH